MLLLGGVDVLEVCRGRVPVGRLAVGAADRRVLTGCSGRRRRGCHARGVELLGGRRLGRRMRGLGRAPVGAVLLVSLEEREEG